MRDLNSDKGRRDEGKDAGLRRGKEADATELQKAKVEGEEELGSLGEKQTCEDQLWRRGVRSTRLSAFTRECSGQQWFLLSSSSIAQIHIEVRAEVGRW